jgi:hypothetical protein
VPTVAVPTDPTVKEEEEPHFYFTASRNFNIRGKNVFRALLTHLQEALLKLAAPGFECSTPILVQPSDIVRTQDIKCRLCSAS